ncbi:Uncharacterised protein [Shigella sonnei]|jgi:hypothetical protein|uniref:hypothetical protein n=1 Tax=Enterobacteriaceae TaxID=543 RepID=UPI0006637275|nr:MULTISPECIES: hypothetical protein [Enterobacteriaceae]EFA4532232.1 hypothetical protein [Escherichia coli]EFA7545180.1 hypothetical protein [Escherichia coli]EFA7621320.1 hypothetical protein [Escherichia coli]EFB2164025.1 hypothetical protein [Escherichia coli]EFC6161690.1 hypothetical protein [Escherichia coli]
MDKKALLFEMIRKRSEKSFSDGGDGFVFASMLAFDVGLNSRIVKRMLDSAVRDGLLEVVGRGVGREHKYRTTKIFNQLIY